MRRSERCGSRTADCASRHRRGLGPQRNGDRVLLHRPRTGNSSINRRWSSRRILPSAYLRSSNMSATFRAMVAIINSSIPAPVISSTTASRSIFTSVSVSIAMPRPIFSASDIHSESTVFCSSAIVPQRARSKPRRGSISLRNDRGLVASHFFASTDRDASSVWARFGL